MATGVDGLASGINSGEIIDAMVNAQRQSTRLVEGRKTKFSAKLEAVRSFNSKLLVAQVNLADLKRPSTFQVRTATSSNEAALAASASSSAAVGSYSFDVTALAQAHQVATGRQASDTGNLGAGSFTIQAGNGVQKTIDISDASKSSLRDVAKAINDAGVGATAYVVKDAHATEPYRLVIQAKDTGASNAIAITGATGGFTSVLDQSSFSTLTAAQDAAIRFGSGVGAITINSAGNTFTGVIPGVTLTAKTVANGISLNVGTNSGSAKEKIKGFVDSLNTAIQYLNTNASYDKDTKQAGILFSDTDLRRALDSVRSSMLKAVPGLPSSMNTMSAIGITIDKQTGAFVIDETKLGEKLAADPDGVMKLFGNSGTSSDTRVQFASVTDKTSVDAPFAVEITQAAEQALKSGSSLLGVDGGNPLGGGPITIDASNDDFRVTINGELVVAKLARRTYATPAELAEHVQGTINATVVGAGNKVSLSMTADHRMELRTSLYGSTTKIAVDNLSTANGLFGFDASEDSGQDVKATIDGGSEVTGVGQILNGGVGTSSEGLRLLVTATAPTPGVSITALKGLAQTVGEKLTALTNTTNGSVIMKEDGLEAQISGLDKQIAKMDERLEVRRARYQSMFLRMEQLISQFQGQGNFFAGQIKGFENMAASKR